MTPLWSMDPRNDRPLVPGLIPPVQVPNNLYMPQMSPQGPAMAPIATPDVSQGPPGAIEEASGPPGSVEEVGGAGLPGEGDQASLVKSALGKIFSSRGLAALGVGLSGLGPQQFQNQGLQKMVMQRMQQQDQSAGVGQVFNAMSAASQTTDPNEALRRYDAARQDPAIMGNPVTAKLYLEHRTKLAEKAYAAGNLDKTRAALTALGDNPTKEDYARVAAAQGVPLDELVKLAGMFPNRFGDVTTAAGQPQRVDYRAQGSRPVGPSRREVSGGQIVAPYEETPFVAELPKTEKLSPGESLVRTVPGQAPTTQMTAKDRPTEAARRGAEILRLDLATASPAQLGVAASIGTLAERMRPETIETLISQNQIDSVLPGMGDAMRNAKLAPAMGAALKQEQQNRLDVSTGQGEAAARIREEAMRRAAPIEREGLRGSETEIYDRTSGKFVNKLDRGFQERVDTEPGRFATVQGDNLKSLRGIRAIEGFIPIFEETAKKLANQPGANLTQAAELRLKELLGVPSMGTVLNTLKSSQLVLAKAFQGSAQNLSDADRKTVEGLVPSDRDSRGQVEQKINFLKTYTKLIKASALDDDDMANFALVDFVRGLPWASGNLPSPPAGFQPRAR